MRRQRERTAAALTRMILPTLAAAAALALAATASEGEAQLVFSRISLQDGGQVAWQRRLAQGSEARLGSEGPPLPSRGRCGGHVVSQHASRELAPG